MSSPYRAHSVADYAASAVGLPASRILRRTRNFEKVSAGLAEPKETLKEIRTAWHQILPGALFKRRLLFRYSLVWTKTWSILTNTVELRHAPYSSRFGILALHSLCKHSKVRSASSR